MNKATKLSGTVALGTVAAVAAIPAAAGALTIPEVESNDTFPGQAVSMNVGDVITGAIRTDTDDIDFFNIAGLPPGGTAVFALNMSNASHLGTLEAGVYTDQTTAVSSVDIDANPTLLSATISSGGDLVLGVKEQGSATQFESYNITLQSVREAQGVPEPATLVLLGAGLAGLHIARRRKRR